MCRENIWIDDIEIEEENIEIDNAKNDVPVEPIDMVKNYALGKGFDSCVDCQNCKNSAIDESYDENCNQYGADSPAPSSPMLQDPRPGPPPSSRSTKTVPVATASGSPAASSCLTPGPSSETSGSEVFHSAKRGKYPYPGDQYPAHLSAEAIKTLEKRYKALPEEYYTKTHQKVITPQNVEEWLRQLRGGSTWDFWEGCSGTGRLSLTARQAGMKVIFPIDLRYG